MHTTCGFGQDCSGFNLDIPWVHLSYLNRVPVLTWPRALCLRIYQVKTGTRYDIGDIYSMVQRNWAGRATVLNNTSSFPKARLEINC